MEAEGVFNPANIKVEFSKIEIYNYVNKINEREKQAPLC